MMSNTEMNLFYTLVQQSGVPAIERESSVCVCVVTGKWGSVHRCYRSISTRTSVTRVLCGVPLVRSRWAAAVSHPAVPLRPVAGSSTPQRIKRWRQQKWRQHLYRRSEFVPRRRRMSIYLVAIESASLHGKSISRATFTLSNDLTTDFVVIQRVS